MTAALTKALDQLPDRAAVVWRALLELGLAENICLKAPARVLSEKTNLSTWDVAYGLGYLSLTGHLHYQVVRDHIHGERVYRIVLRGQLLPSSAPEKSAAQLLTEFVCVSFNKSQRVSEGLVRGEEGGKSAGADLSTELAAIGVKPDYCRTLLEKHITEHVRSALKAALEYPPERIRKTRLAIFFAILNRKSYAGGTKRPRPRSGRPDGTKSIDALYSEGQSQRRLDIRY